MLHQNRRRYTIFKTGHLEFIELKARLEPQMRLDICSGCDLCGLRCAAGVPVGHAEWESLQVFLAGRTEAERAEIQRVELQDKTVDLGDGVAVQMCRFRDMHEGRCMVYVARPLACKLMGHVEWMPCPVEAIPNTLPTPDALELMRLYAEQERRTFEEWADQPA